MPTTVANWYDDVMPEIPGDPPQTLVDYHIKQAIIDFCTRSQWLRRTSAAFNSSGSQAAMAFPAAVVSATEKVVDILDVWWLDKELTAKSVEELQNMYPDWRTASGTPLYYTQDGEATFWLAPSLTSVVTNALKMRVAYSYLDSATIFDDTLLTRWREPIGFGSKARLMVMTGKPWSNPALAGTYFDVFDYAIESAKMKADKGTKKTQFQTKPYHF